MLFRQSLIHFQITYLELHFLYGTIEEAIVCYNSEAVAYSKIQNSFIFSFIYLFKNTFQIKLLVFLRVLKVRFT